MMGWWRSRNGTSGDTPADILGSAFDEIGKAYQKEWNRNVTLGELRDAITFVLHDKLEVVCREPTDTPYPFPFP